MRSRALLGCHAPLWLLAVLTAALPACARVSHDFPPCQPAQVAESGDALDVTCWVPDHVDVVAFGAAPVLGPFAHTTFLTVVDLFGPDARSLEFSSGARSHDAEGYQASLSSRGTVQGHRVLGVRVQPPPTAMAAPAGPLARVLEKLAAAYPDAARASVTVMSTRPAEQGGMLRLECEQWRVVAADWSERVD